MAEAPAERPLVGVRVLDCLAGPMGAIGRQLAELGADVLRVESRGGAVDRTEGFLASGMSLAFAAANLGKRAVGLDLTDATDLEAFATLVADADILIANGALDVDALADRHPALVILSVTPFGRTGPLRDWQGSGPVFHALSGELSRSGIPGRPPLLPPGDLTHACAAGQAAYVVLLAYFNRLRTGRGDLLDFSILDGAVQALDPGYGIGGSATAGIPASNLPRGRPDARHQYPIVPCEDGYVRLCILAVRQWQGMFEWLGRPEEFADPSYNLIQNRFASPTLVPAIARFFAGKTRRDLEEAGQRHGVPTAAVLDLDEAMTTEQIIARKAFVPVEIAPGVTVPLPDGVIEIDGARMGIAGPPPAIDSDAAWKPAPPMPQAPSDGSPHPLSGLRVLDLGVIVVGADQGRLLADQGADVAKVENAAFPDGSRQSRTGAPVTVTFAAGHRNKRGLGLNLREPEGKALLLDLIRDTDVLLSNFKAGTLASLGLDYGELSKINPGIIVVDSSAFGPTGPWSRRMGYGPLVRASAGLTMQWRYPEDPESFSDAITVYPDHVAARIGIVGVLALLIRRLRTGRGGTVSISQAEVMLSHMAAQIAHAAAGRAGVALTGGDAAETQVLAAAGDDEWCVVTLRDDADCAALRRVIGDLDLAAWMREQDARAAMKTLQAAGIPAGTMLRVSELPDFDHYRARDAFRPTSHPHIDERFFQEVAPVLSRTLPDPPARPAPLMGEHTAEILRERLDVPEAEIARLVSIKALEIPAPAINKEPA